MNNAGAMPVIIKGAYGFNGEVVIVTGAARGKLALASVCVGVERQRSINPIDS